MALVLVSLAGLLALAVAIVFVLLRQGKAADHLNAVVRRQHTSRSLAHQLKQSSDDLTRMVRSYAATGDPRFEENFYTILRIRNGEAPRPKDYNHIFWDFQVAGGAAVRGADGEKTSLQALMKRMGLTQEELDILAEVQLRSDELVRMEETAINAVNGRFRDATGAFTAVREPDRELALQILFGEEYLRAKSAIMKPIKAFLVESENRTRRVVAEAQAEHRSLSRVLVSLFTGAVVILPLFGLACYRYHKASTDDLAGSEQRFRSLMEQSPLAIEILSPDGRISRVNPAWRRLWGLTEEGAAEVLREYNMLTDRQTQELGVARLVRRAFDGEAVVLPPIEYSGTQALEDVGLDAFKARTPWIQCHLYAVRDAEGKVLFVVNTYLEITELKRAEQEAREQRDALARMERTSRMGQLTGSIAHEVNQPLTGILSNAQAGELLIETGNYDLAEMAEILREITSDAKRAGDVIRNLRDLYREQKGELEPIDVNAVVAEAAVLVNSELLKRNIELRRECAPSVPKVNGHRVQLEQVLVNLIMNGGQAMEDKPKDDRRLCIATACDADEVKVWIEDSGPGIDAAKLDEIFEPLATWKPGGTGMGLAISNAIITAHGGRMWAENRPEGGARVGFVIPVFKDDDA
jgi:signal transduction histidine kinase